MAHSLSGDSDSAVRAAAPVLAVGARTGLCRTITDTGPELARLLQRVAAAGRGERWLSDLEPVPSDYVARLLATVHAERDEPARRRVESSPAGGPASNEPLSAREIDILRLLERGLSNKEIARNLSVTINTVKWYLKSIYLKLDVARRGEAVSEARRRSILG